jgi:Do/DeqQ family serine protease
MFGGRRLRTVLLTAALLASACSAERDDDARSAPGERPVPLTLSTEDAASLIDPQRGVLSLAPVLDVATQAVVNIAVEASGPVASNPLFRDPYFRRRFGAPEQRRVSAGSGVIVDASAGYILTNYHVIAGADRLAVTLKDGRTLEGRLIGSDEATDLALLEVEAENLVALPFAETGEVRVGDFVLAIGNPFGLGQTVTSGIVSATGRGGLNPANYEDFIQTDAPINPGNSGGALINTRGELVGVNTAIISPAGGNVGIGFAVPSSMARSVMEQLVRNGEVRRGRMGAVVQDLTPDIAQSLGADITQGAVIAAVEPGSAAQGAGVQPGDVVITVDGDPVLGAAQLRNRIGLTEVGTTVRLELVRNGERRAVELRIGRR